MKTTVIILFLFLIQTLNGQNNITKLKSILSNIEYVDSISTIKKTDFKSVNILSIYHSLERQIDFGYEHHRFMILIIPGGDLMLDIITKNEIVKMGWLSEYHFLDSKENSFVFKSTNGFLKKYVRQHNLFYNTDFEFSDFINQILTEYVVAFGCGYDGNAISKEAKKSSKWAKNKNERKLMKYLTSFSPELQTLGTIGLLEIGNLSNEQKRIIEHLKKRNSIIFSCMGCEYGVGETYKERIEGYQ